MCTSVYPGYSMIMIPTSTQVWKLILFELSHIGFGANKRITVNLNGNPLNPQELIDIDPVFRVSSIQQLHHWNAKRRRSAASATWKGMYSAKRLMDHYLQATYRYWKAWNHSSVDRHNWWYLYCHNSMTQNKGIKETTLQLIMFSLPIIWGQ